MIPIGEACLLVRALLEDPRSRVASEVAGWSHPVSREWMMLAFVHDVVVDTTPGVKNPGRFHMPRPWDSGTKKLGGGTKRTAKQALAILRPG